MFTENDQKRIKAPSHVNTVLTPFPQRACLDHLVDIYQACQFTFSGSLRQKILFVLRHIFCIAMALPDALTYHAYSVVNGRIVYHAVGGGPLGHIIQFWIAIGAPFGVFCFALNNMYRWTNMLNEAIRIFPHYNKKTARWSIFLWTTVCGALSVVPFYGMASNANMLYVFVIGNSVARFCMDHYAWQEIISGAFDKQMKSQRFRLIGIPVFITGMITATYLFPFAVAASNVPFAILGVAPTCLLWGLDSRAAYIYFCESCSRRFSKSAQTHAQSPIRYDRDLCVASNVTLLIMSVIAFAGAISETMMAGQNAKTLFYPSHFLVICAGIAFTGIYLTGPIQLVRGIFDFLQQRRGNENAQRLYTLEHEELKAHLRSKLSKQTAKFTLAKPGNPTSS